eukprot:TRINITY_DN3016_c0_g1_i3.p1 TRINITY_DN3016_c0_g1~~TRINITY_DN3016_c0_g1_i3.p1  ORF type:complete len:1427 (-),score=285.07 TRINITY_DN3016_c0_g1_i3:135-4358(-)
MSATKEEPGAAGQNDRDIAFGKAAPRSAFLGNTVRTSKYTILTFLPLNLWEQLHRAANVYFLLMSILMAAGQYTPLFESSVKAFSTASVLVLMMCISAVMAALDDLSRHKADAQVNSRSAARVDLSSGSVVQVKWSEIKVGDVCVVKKNEEVPADMVVLGSSDATGRLYVETMNLDGETNLKGKAAVEKTQTEITATTSGDVEKIGKMVCEGKVVAECPSKSIYSFKGNINLSGTTYPLMADHLLLRSTVLRNTAWVVGVVVYTGKETRVVMNSRQAPLKLSSLEKATNRCMLVIVVLQLVMTIVCAIMFTSTKGDFTKLWYLSSGEEEKLWLPDALAYFLTFFCLYSNLVPISMYSTMEIANVAQTLFVSKDVTMYDKATDKFAKVRSMNLVQEIGMISYVFSDKTGTLTQNVMELRQISIDGEVCGKPPSAADPPPADGKRRFSGAEDVANARKKLGETKVAKFAEILAVCHTVVAEKAADGELKMEAESPDELALVQAAVDMGWSFQQRSNDQLKVIADGKEKSYQILGINAFTSARKRMSMLVKRGDTGEYVLLAKGADNIMMGISTAVPGYLKGQLYDFACQGLRTLVIGQKIMPEKEALAWVEKYKAAQSAMTNRDQQLDELAAQAEQAIEIVGITAVEDKLQDYVADTISKVKKGGVKVWVLTGDKLETARNIGFSCSVLSDNMEIIIMDTDPENATGSPSEQMDKALSTAMIARRTKPVGLLITGGMLETVLADLGGQFLELGEMCDVVIACRVSPSQKGEVVKLVRYGVKPSPVTLAIGDGANDVAMIQEAHVGVGISGKEGTQAVNAADFAISQFSFLMTLMMVHGRWNYRRLSKFILFSFHKNIAQCLQLFTYTFFCAYSGTSLYEDWVRNSFNLIVGFPVIFLGFFDRDLDRKQSLADPEGYSVGRLGQELNIGKMVFHICQAIVLSLIITMISLLSYDAFAVSKLADYYSWGTICYVCLIVAMLYRLAFMMTTWNAFVVLALVLTFIGLWISLFVCGVLTTLMGGVVAQILASPLQWVCMLATPLCAMVADLVLDAVSLAVGYARGKISLGTAIGRAVGQEGAQGRGERSVGWKQQFFQQDLPSLQRERNTKTVGGGLLCSGALLLLLGAVLMSTASVPMAQIQYAGTELKGRPVDEFTFKKCNDGSRCNIPFKIKEKMQGPIYVMYSVDPFYMSSNQFMKSTSISELTGTLGTEEQAEADCISKLKEDGERLWPCGLKAASLFNDTYVLMRKESKQVNIKESGIAWDSDLKFLKNPREYPTASGIKWLYERFPDITGLEKDGVRNEHFAVWNRPAALPNTLKLWGIIEEDLAAGEELNLVVDSNFPVAQFDEGKKSLVLVKKGPLGGRSDGLGLALVVIGVIGSAFGVVVLIAHFIGSKKAPTSPSDDVIRDV